MAAFWEPFEDAAQAGLDAAGIHPYARPSPTVTRALLAGLDEAGLLMTAARLDTIASAVEEIDTVSRGGLTPETVLYLAADTVRSGGAEL